MSIPTSHRPAREWLLLLLALAVVGGITVPLWRMTGGAESQAELLSKWTPDRLAKLLLGPEQVLCYVCAVWAGLILQSRYREVVRQRQAFGMDLLPTEEGARILPEDARPLSRKIEQVTARRPFILANMIRLGLGKYAISKSAPDVAEVVRNQADVESSRLVSTMGTVHYLAWAIPAIGFVGTVRGLAGAFGMAGVTDLDMTAFTRQATDQLKIAFDCTLVALLLSLVLMYLVHTVQRAEEVLVVDSQEYCQEHLLLRLYDPAATEAAV
ncbi:MAG TPA: MotA/TolQ/ExbB proton channel family protein [Gemmataceae bacterium]|nr:MotA/TolQ/ExbB proton channel family protein [Gemmataceae bacterium]